MNKVCFTFLLFFFLSCSAVKNPPKASEPSDSDERLVKQFKISFFQRCLATKSPCLKEFFMGDGSVASDYPLGIINYRRIDSLAKIIKEEIHADSVNWTNEICKDCPEDVLDRFRANGMIGKSTLRFCLDYYTSNELDSIARASINGMYKFE